MIEDSELITSKQKINPFSSLVTFISISLLILILVVLGLFVSTQKPRGFDTEKEFIIESGDNALIISKNAKAQGLVRSETIFYITLSYLHDTKNIYAGKYAIKPGNVFAVAKVIAANEIVDDSYRLTIPEGLSVKQIAAIISQQSSVVIGDDFYSLASSSEGYLYPETYFIPDLYTAEQIFKLLRDTHDEKFQNVKQTASSTLSDHEVLVLASIIEREANDEDSMRMVSAILQNRLAIGMALQADASIEYVLEKPLKDLTTEDLKIDSPYNTYLYPGLPPTPIGNPGRQSIEAVYNPAETQDLYYITDDEGGFHYASTYEQHLDNVRKYLR